MAWDTKKRLVLVGALLGATVWGIQLAEAQVDPAGSAQQPGVQPAPGLQPQPMLPQPTTGFSSDAGVGGGGLTPPPLFGSPDAGIGGSGPPLPDPLGFRDAGPGRTGF